MVISFFFRPCFHTLSSFGINKKWLARSIKQVFIFSCKIWPKKPSDQFWHQRVCFCEFCQTCSVNLHPVSFYIEDYFYPACIPHRPLINCEWLCCLWMNVGWKEPLPERRAAGKSDFQLKQFDQCSSHKDCSIAWSILLLCFTERAINMEVYSFNINL